MKWYNCGPTVYDASHMGHARCVHIVRVDDNHAVITDSRIEIM